MYVKTLIFLTAVFSLTGNIQAGVISALWLDQGNSEVGMSVLVEDQESPVAPENQPHDGPIVDSLSDCQSGLAGVTVSASGASIGGIAWSGIAYVLQIEPKLQCRLSIINDLLPDSPTLCGLLKPS
jgi:hypothetical protein